MAKVTTAPQVTKAEPVVNASAPKVDMLGSVKKADMKGNFFMFDKMNYQIMIGGLVLIALGFILMAGGRGTDPNEFKYEEMYSTRRITVAPILVMLGFVVELFAIFYTPKNKA